MTAIRYVRFESPLGPMLAAAGETGLAGVWFTGQKYPPALASDWEEAPRDPLLHRVQVQLDEYFRGARTRFGLPLAPHGTSFQRRVWAAIAEVPYGRTVTYAALARAAASPRGVRATGAATGRNPLSIVVPCHRIVGAHGALTGYAGGIERKRALLELEARTTLGQAA
jgi:methylated-DNA-[protein]-cysteine S-methyltransferase